MTQASTGTPGPPKGRLGEPVELADVSEGECAQERPAG
jgi:hypothetical protein